MFLKVRFYCTNYCHIYSAIKFANSIANWRLSNLFLLSWRKKIIFLNLHIGLDTIINSVLFNLFNLAKNPLSQDRLFDEVQENMTRKVTLDWCTPEPRHKIRKSFPPLFLHTKKCYMGCKKIDFSIQPGHVYFLSSPWTLNLNLEPWTLNLEPSILVETKWSHSQFSPIIHLPIYSKG